MHGIPFMLAQDDLGESLPKLIAVLLFAIISGLGGLLKKKHDDTQKQAPPTAEPRAKKPRKLASRGRTPELVPSAERRGPLTAAPPSRPSAAPRPAVRMPGAPAPQAPQPRVATPAPRGSDRGLPLHERRKSLSEEHLGSDNKRRSQAAATPGKVSRLDSPGPTRRVLGRVDAESLREAVVLSEILKPPLALRPYND